MAKNDYYVKRMMQNPAIFADLFNVRVFGGRQVIRPEELLPVPEETGIVVMDSKKRTRTLQRRRDVSMKTTSGLCLTVLACEIQDGIHYGMVIRSMMYDALDYTDQVRELEEVHRKRKNLASGDEFLSGIAKDDVLCPVVTLIFYYGRKDWDGKTSLHELLGVKKDTGDAAQLLRFIPDYHINLVNATDETHIEQYQSDLQYVLGMLKCNQNKTELYRYARDNRRHLTAMAADTASAMLAMLGEQKRLMKILETESAEGGIDMCKAIDDLIADGREDGIKQGIERGLERGIEQGLERGIEQGLEQGLEQGERQEAARYSRLILRLSADGKSDQIISAARNPETLQKLYREYGL